MPYLLFSSPFFFILSVKRIYFILSIAFLHPSPTHSLSLSLSLSLSHSPTHSLSFSFSLSLSLSLSLFLFLSLSLPLYLSIYLSTSPLLQTYFTLYIPQTFIIRRWPRASIGSMDRYNSHHSPCVLVFSALRPALHV